MKKLLIIVVIALIGSNAKVSAQPASLVSLRNRILNSLESLGDAVIWLHNPDKVSAQIKSDWNKIVGPSNSLTLGPRPLEMNTSEGGTVYGQTKRTFIIPPISFIGGLEGNYIILDKISGKAGTIVYISEMATDYRSDRLVETFVFSNNSNPESKVFRIDKTGKTFVVEIKNKSFGNTFKYSISLERHIFPPVIQGPPPYGNSDSPSGITTGSSPVGTTGSPSGITAGTPSVGTTGSPSGITTGTPSVGTTGSPSGITTGSPPVGTTGSPSGITTGSPPVGTTGSPSGTTAVAPSGSDPATTGTTANCNRIIKFRKGTVLAGAPARFMVTPTSDSATVIISKKGGRARTTVNFYVNGNFQSNLIFENNNGTETGRKLIPNVKNKELKVEIINQSIGNQFEYAASIVGVTDGLLENGLAQTGNLLGQIKKTVESVGSCSGKARIIIKRTSGDARGTVIIWKKNGNFWTQLSSDTFEPNEPRNQKVYNINTNQPIKIELKNISVGNTFRYNIDVVAMQ